MRWERWYKGGMRRRGRTLGAAVLAVAVTVGAGMVSVRADDDPALEPVDARELLSSVIEASLRGAPISGEVETTFDLGLPELPGSMGGIAGAPGVLASFTGDQRWKVWSSPDGLRVAHLLQAREQDLVVNRDEAWWWDSAEMRAIHLDPADLDPGWPDVASTPNGSPAPPVDPVALATALIRGASPCASLSQEGTYRVAGRDVYVLALSPSSSGSLVGSIRLSVDAQTRLPLRVEVRSIGGDDAPIAAGFTSVSFDPIDPAMCSFEPPPGATVSEASEVAEASGADEATGDAEGAGPAAITDARVFGGCLGVVVALRLDGRLPDAAAGLLPFAGPLSSAIAVERSDHTWVLAGLVDADALEARAATLP